MNWWNCSGRRIRDEVWRRRLAHRNEKPRSGWRCFMAMIPGWLSIDERCVGPALQDAVEKLDGRGGEAVVNFSAVWRLDPTALRAMEEFVGAADEKGVNVVLRGVSVDVYKVLKLTKLASRFSFSS